MPRDINLKTRILLPIALVLLILYGVTIFSLYQHEKTDAGLRFNSVSQSVKAYYLSALARRSDKLGAALEAILQDSQFQAALRARDRDALLRQSAPLFKRLLEQYGITHFYFSDAARTNLLRVHQPERFGDIVDRHTTLTAEKTGKTAIGVELGVFGTFTLRAVAPMYDKTGLIGYAELGQEIEDMLHGVKDVIGIENLLLIDKQFLARQEWENGMRMLGRNVDWDQLPGAVITLQTIDLSREQMGSILLPGKLPGTVTDMYIGDKHYYADVMPIEDAAGRKVGGLVILQDMTANTDEMLESMLYLSAFYLPLAGMLFALLYLITRRVERSLNESNRKLLAQGQEREAIQAQHIAELKEERDKLRDAQLTLQKNEGDLRLAATVFENSTEGILITDTQSRILRVNRAFTEITGYSEEEAIGQTPQMLRSDRHDAAFYQWMWASLIEYGYWQGEIWNRRKNGEAFPEWLTLVAIRDEKKTPLYYLGVFADLTEKKMSEARAHHLSNYDALTELPNRNLLEQRLKQALTEAQNHGGVMALQYLDLDRFNTIIDTLGHAFGDKLLRAVAERLAGHIRDSDTLARFSGDEFAVVLSDVGSQQNATMVALKILNALSAPFNLDGQEIFITASIGIALYPFDAGNSDELIRNANVAARHIKENGGGGYRFYTADMNATSSHRLLLETSLRRALGR
ncbi:MAG: diguanylate cyclase, partial [Gallionella sp.]|nr:diguanylate cyclase [Gallionella sp.]